MPAHTIEIQITAEDKAKGVLGGFTSSVAGLGKTLAIGLAGGVAAVGAVGAAIGKLAMDATKIEPVRRSFENLSKSIGETSQAMLTELRQATMGAMRDADLMQAGSKLMAMGLASSREEAGKLAKMATALGVAMGEDAGTALENFTLMLANQSIPRLDTFGISSGKVRERILELMEANKSLTREQAFMQAVMEQGAIAMAKVGDVSDTSAITMAQLGTILANLKDTVGTAFIPVLKAVLVPLRDLALTVGPRVQEWAERFADWLQAEGIPALTDFGQGIARWVVPGFQGFADVLERVDWEALKTTFTVIADRVRMFGETIAKWITGTAVPALQGFVDKIDWEAIKGFLGGIITGLGDIKDKAVEWIVGTAIPALQEFGQKAQKWIMGTAVPALQAFGEKAQEWITGVAVPTLQGLIEDVDWEAIRTQISEAGASITTAFADIDWEKIREGAGTLLEGLGERFGPTIERIKEAFAGLGESFAPVIPKLQELREAALRVLEKIGVAVSAIGTVVGAVVAVVAMLLGEILAGILANAGQIVGGAVDVITASFRGIDAVLTGLIEIVKALIEGDWAMAWEAAKTMAVGFADAVLGILTGLATVVDGLMAVIFNAITNTVNNLLGTNLPQWSEFKEGVVAVFEGLKESVSQAIGNVLAAILAAINEQIEPIRSAFDGIRSAVEETVLPAFEGVRSFVEEILIPLFAALAEVVDAILGLAITALAGLCQNVLQPALEAVSAFIQDNVLAVFTALWAFVQDSLIPAFTLLWAFLQDNVLPVFMSLAGFVGDNVLPVLTSLAAFVRDNVVGGFTSLCSIIKDSVTPILQSLVGTTNETVKPSLSALQGIIESVKRAFEGVKSAIKDATTWLGNIAEAIKKVQLPSWLTPHSVTPFEVALRGIADAARETGAAFGAMVDARGLSRGLAGIGPIGAGGVSVSAPALASAGAGPGSRTVVIAPVFFDDRTVVNAAGQVDYRGMGEFLAKMGGF